MKRQTIQKHKTRGLAGLCLALALLAGCAGGTAGEKGKAMPTYEEINAAIALEDYTALYEVNNYIVVTAGQAEKIEKALKRGISDKDVAADPSLMTAYKSQYSNSSWGLTEGVWIGYKTLYNHDDGFTLGTRLSTDGEETLFQRFYFRNGYRLYIGVVIPENLQGVEDIDFYILDAEYNILAQIIDKQLYWFIEL